MLDDANQFFANEGVPGFAPAPGGTARSRVISLFAEIKQVIGCKVSVIMGRAAVPLGQSGRNGHTRARCDGGGAELRRRERLT
jgi:hypothetical protein